MRKTFITAIPVILVLLALPLRAEDSSLRNHPGYFDFSVFESFAVEGETVDVSLDETLIHFTAASMEEDQPELAAALRKIKRVAVRTFAIDKNDTEEIKSQVAAVEQQLESESWTKVVRVMEKSEQVNVFIKSSAGVIDGLAVMVFEFGDEAVFVNVMGEIDPQTLGKIMANIGALEDSELGEFLKEFE